MAAELLTTATERWIREKLQLNHPNLGDVRSLSLPGGPQQRICRLGDALRRFVRLKALDLSYNALASIKGIEHLKGLERLILYSNCISSFQEVKELDELPALRELDLRLNPVTRLQPRYRSCLVQAVPRLSILDGRLITETERRAAVMHFSSTNEGQGEERPLSDSASEPTRGVKPKDLAEQRSLTQQQNTFRYIPGSPASKYEDKESKLLHTEEISDQITTSSNASERLKVTFGPGKEKYKSVSAERKKNGLPIKSRHIAKGYYTPNPNHHSNSSLVNIRPRSLRRGSSLSDLSSPILLPPRLTNKTEGGPSVPQQEGKRTRGGYRKPLEMLLNLVDKHWTGERSLHHHNDFPRQSTSSL